MNLQAKRLLREAVIADIMESFRSATRDNAVSWETAKKADYYEAFPEREKDTHWSQLIDDPSFNAKPRSAWHFLDGNGFRYYLPIAMIREIREPPEAFCLCDLLMPHS